MKYIMLITTLDLCIGWGLHIPPFYCDILNIKIDYIFLQIPSNPFQTLKKKKEKQEQLHESLLEIIVLAASETSGGYIIYISNFTWLNCQFLKSLCVPLCREKVVACAKHYVGDGGTTKGINANNTVIDRHGLLSTHMPGYYNSIIKGVASIMISYSSWNGIKMHANRDLVTGFLKKTLRFRVKRDSWMYLDFFNCWQLKRTTGSNIWIL